MSICLEVGLLSGKTATVQASLSDTVQTLKRRAQISLGVGRGQLLDSSGRVLDTCAQIKKLKLQTGDSLTLHRRQVRACATGAAFAAILGDASVVTWGDSADGGDSSAMQDRLTKVQQIRAAAGVSASAFAAILDDGSVATWGNAVTGGDSSAVQDRLKNVQQIQATGFAFAAILGDGSVMTWGLAGQGGDSSLVQDQLKDVCKIMFLLPLLETDPL